MRMLERNAKNIYYSKRHLTEDGVEYFDVPVKISANAMPVSTDWTRTEKGEVTGGMKRFHLSQDMIRDKNLNIDYGDRFYIDAVVPEYTDINMAEDADYVVIGLEKTPSYLAVILQRRSI